MMAQARRDLRGNMFEKARRRQRCPVFYLQLTRRFATITLRHQHCRLPD